MKTVNIHKAKTELSKLIALVEAGEEVTISRRNVPVARIVPAHAGGHSPRVPGALSHVRNKPPENLFLEPLEPEDLDAWDGGFSFPDKT